MNQFSSIKRSGDNVYYNIVITNNTTISQVAEFQETRIDDIISHMEDFHMAVVRFGIPTADIPIIQNFQNNFYSITLLGTGATGQRNGPLTGGTASQQFLTYEPIDDSGTNYIFNYNSLCYMMNQAFYNATIAIGATASISPYMIFNSTTQLFSIYTPISGLAGIWFNQELYSLFPSFPFTYFNTQAVADANMGLFAQLPSIGSTTVSNIPNFNQIDQETADTISLWTARSIRFATNVPIRNEYLPYNGSSQNSGANNNTMSVLTDFDLPLDSISQIRPYAQFFPQGPYRLIDLIGNGSLRRFNLKLFVVDQLETLTPLTIPPNQSMSIKILFQNKSLSKKYF